MMQQISTMVPDEGGEGRGTARSEGRGQEFRPTPLMERALAVAVENPHLSRSVKELAELAGCSETALKAWRRDARFRGWWNACLLELARESIGPMVLELQRLVHSDEVAPGVKAKLLDSIIKAIPPADAKDDAGTAVLAILERWQPGAYKARIEATQGRIRAEIDAVMPAKRDENATIDTAKGVQEAAQVVQANMQRAMVRVLEGDRIDPSREGQDYGGEYVPPRILPRGEGGAKSQREPEQVDEPRPYPPPPKHSIRNGVCTRCGDPESKLRSTCPDPTGPPPDRGVYRILRRESERSHPPGGML